MAYKGEKFGEVEVEVDQDEVRVTTGAVSARRLTFEEAKAFAAFVEAEVFNAQQARGDFND